MPTTISRQCRRYFVVALVASLVSACSTMTPPRYTFNADTQMMLRNLQGKSVAVVSLRNEAVYDANCRLMGPIRASDNRNVGQFVRDSFNDEFKFAGIYGGDNAVNKLELLMSRAVFSSMDSLTKGSWELEITLSNVDTGEKLQASTRYVFPSGFDAITACNQTADALTPAVQDLIKSTVSKSDFKKFISRN